MLRYALKNGVTLTDTDQAIQLTWSGTNLTLNQHKKGIVDALRILTQSRPTEEELTEIIISQDGGLGMIQWQQCVRQLEQHGIFERTLLHDEKPLASLFVHSEFFRFQQHDVNHAQAYMLSRFAHIRRIEKDVILTSPLGYASLKICPNLLSLISHLYAPQSIIQLSEPTGYSIDLLASFVNLLLNASLLTPVDEQGVDVESQDEALDYWEFHNLVFHASAQDGRSMGRIGGTFRFRDKYPLPPALREPYPSPPIPLAKPDIETIIKDDMTLFEAMETRKSHWEFDDENAISAEQLGIFLYRVARVTKQTDTTLFTGDQEIDFHVAHRPHPSGGAMYPLEIYTAIRTCDGLESGLYHYNPLHHALHHILIDEKKLDRLLEEGSPGPTRNNPPQILFLITARFPRTMWKYEGVSYTLFLKECGVLYQSMYLIATSMGLGACGLGGSNPDLFDKGLYLNEGLIGTLASGSLLV